jgi:hypothetical protein
MKIVDLGMMRNRWIRLCLACLGMILGLTACNYEDGPVLSLRSKARRMDFFRPLTYYENNGIDSTAALNQRFEDSIPSFEGRFYFDWEPDVEIQAIYNGEDVLDATDIGSWEIDGYDDFERIGVYRIPGQTWPPYWWTITRLTHRKLWLEGPGGRLLRFEE